jgi:hypothetical protein
MTMISGKRKIEDQGEMRMVGEEFLAKLDILDRKNEGFFFLP